MKHKINYGLSLTVVISFMIFINRDISEKLNQTTLRTVLLILFAVVICILGHYISSLEKEIIKLKEWKAKFELEER